MTAPRSTNGQTLPRDSGNVRENVFPQAQLSLEFDPDLVAQHASLKECVAARIYCQRGGITAVAGKLDMQPSHLCEVLGGGGDRHRKFDLDELERYIATYRDFTPILYLVSKFMPDAATAHTHAIERFNDLAEQLPQLLASIGAKRVRK